MSFIETERLVIRKWDLERDLGDAFAMYGDPQTMRFIPCGALSREQTQRLVERMIQRDEENGFGIWAVVHKAEQRVIGECGTTYIPEHAFTGLRLPLLYALIECANAASIGVANRLRMEYDKIVRAYKRDLMRYRKVGSLMP